jgi:hypothetical protein
MKIFLAAMMILLLPGLAFGDGICKSLGGICKKACDQGEIQERGSFVDCDKYYCCTPEKSPSVPGKSSKDAKPAPAPAPAAVKEPAGKTVPAREIVRSSPRPTEKILVCYPITDTSAYADTALKCGEKEATLQELYEDNYRLIQIIQDKKAFLYYLEKK